jgi:DNA-binding transcriptional MocR family regulator
VASLTARALVALLGDWRSPTGPVYAALADRIRLLVLDGRIPLGTRLPAERELADGVAVSRTTVTTAYAELRDAGYITSTRGSGSVTRLPGRAPVSIDSVRTGYLDFSKATLPAIPRIAAAAARAAERLPAHLGESGFDPIGLPILREAIAARYTARGLPTDADQVMVTIGAQHAISLLSRTLLARGDRALVEAPSYPHAFDALRAAGARLVPVPVSSDEGWDEAVLEQAIQRTSPAIGYVMPDFHNPTGRSMSVDLRVKTLELAASHGTVLIADETMAELSIDHPNTYLPFSGYDDTDLSILIGSVGKSVWGGVRIGWIRASRPVIQKLVRARSATDLGTPILEQLLVADLLGEYDEVLAERRAYLRAGRDYLEAALKRVFPQWTIPHVDGGLTLWVGLGEAVSSQLTLAARSNGLLLAAGPRFGIDGAFERFLRIPLSHPADDTDRAIEALQAAWATLSSQPLVESSFLADVV